MAKRIMIFLLTVIFGGCLLASASAQTKKLVIRIVSDTSPPPQPIALSMNWFRDKIAERIPGSEVRTYFAGALYAMSDAMSALQAGNLEIAVGQPSKVAGFDPWLNIATQPMVLTSIGAIHHFPETEVAKALTARLAQKGIQIMGWADISHYFGACAKKRLLTPADFKGLKLRVLAPLTQGPMLKAWGSSAVAMSWGDVPSAIQSGVIDGAITTSNGFAVIKEQASYASVIGVGGMAMDFYFMGFSKKWWDGVPPDQQKIIGNTMNEMIAYQQKLQWCSDKLVMQDFGAKDPKNPGFYTLKPEQVEVFKQVLGNKVADALTEKLGPESKSLIYKFQEEGKQLVAKYPPGSDPVETMDCAPYEKLVTYKEQKKK
ncbi:MAG: TRAP transporter substrate-binding protein [Deltaproteobacteria bacterium]|nr:TRAP transporter substrate-binding protein [Deltaproteobacteria bacterium]